jgi:hypothetical protein
MGIEDRQTLRARNRAVTDTRLSSMEQGAKRSGKGRRSLGDQVKVSNNTAKRQRLDAKVGSGRRAAQVRCSYLFSYTCCLDISYSNKNSNGGNACRITISMKQK